MQQLQVHLEEKSYSIYIGARILQQAGTYIRTVYTGGRAAVVTDETVWKLYGSVLTAALLKEGIDPTPIILKPGEESKSLANLGYVLESLAEMGLTRSELLIAFGGGVMGDLGGFAASSYMRGVPFVQIPTTLLSQVDSSVGGKTAVNLPQGKNLVGAFYQPKLVLADTGTLSSLNDREFAGGMAEVIKYGAIFSAAFLQKLQDAKNRAGAMEQIEEIVYQCCDFKRVVVEKDEFDNGERALLNFGHTFGHTIEKLGNFTDYIHGEAVAMGMVLAALYGENLGKTKQGTAKQLYQICLGYGLPVNHEMHPLQMAPLFHLDKKASGKGITLILAEYAGKCFTDKQTLEHFEAAMQQLEQTVTSGTWSR